MKTIAFVIGLCILSSQSHAETIKPAAASSHVGQTVVVEGVVDEVHTSNRGNIFINMGGHYPNQAFTGFIRSQYVSQFPKVHALQGEIVAISGAIQLYKGTPEIILESTSQLTVK
ncbi:hypothetical protein ASC80_14945 [Afipia sp. Root123D2]|uniref:hypothetical protein n=1 Tax=Afipia sp. Root123D2 TaxID=1736436 RepID=UPI0006FFC684|nr:hypothetical protein [Afipia sp. Root123D2]KQW21376.1 hypothetical protein ASC80_14945 [Afipia sp. Root123D2]